VRAGNNPLDAMQERVQSRIRAARPWTREDIYLGFVQLGFVPGGLFVPDARAITVERKLRDLGSIYDEIDRDTAYLAYQRETEFWFRAGEPGHWTWQQALARSEARQLACWGRRGGKSIRQQRSRRAGRHPSRSVSDRRALTTSAARST
jgi:hypothetical protein